jgi:hypothetical protein
MMDTNEIISKLESEWEAPDGLFYQLRYKGIFDVEKHEKYVKLLRSIEINGEQINRRLVSLLWILPLFLSWQKERVLAQKGDVRLFQNAINEIVSIVTEKLGVP